MMLQSFRIFVLCFLPLFFSVSLSYEARNPEVVALISFRNGLNDPHGAFSNWDEDSVDPCSWAMITCSPDNLVTGLGAPSQGLSGTLPGVIANLTNLRQVLLQNNNISGRIPAGIGHLPKLQTLDLSNNKLTSHVPESLSHLSNLQYLRLNNNTLSGAIPLSLASLPQLALLDLSNNNLSGPVPKFSTRTFNIVGNPMICGSHANEGCYGSTLPEPLSFNLNPSSGKNKSKKVVVALGISLGCLVLLLASLGVLLWKRGRNQKQSILDINGKPPLDWTARKRIAIGAARGLLYLHEQCDPKIIHRDVKAANVLLDEFNEAVVGDFGLAKLLDHADSHVTTEVRGTVGHIAPEYLSTGQSSEKTDVFGFGILLLELITGMRAFEFGKTGNQKGAMLEWVKKAHQEKKVELLTDKELGTNYDQIDVREMLQVALLCTQYTPAHRPRMSEVVRMLEGDGLAEKWAATHNNVNPNTMRKNGMVQKLDDNDDDYTSSMLGVMLMDDDHDPHAMELSGPR
ncbi:putative protein kinase RLK-Pelle-LRR-II family [Helianthus annuus]|nr:putative protein kinase RLK-Pelle-LRR-II family [Helianthus annuus]